MMGQNRSGMRISSVSSAGYVSAAGRSPIMRGFGCPSLPSRNSTTFFMFLVSFATNIYFYIENQELLHNLAYKEIHESLKIEECRKLMAIQDKKFHEQLLNSKSQLNNFQMPKHEAFNERFNEAPSQVHGMPGPSRKYVPDVKINAAPRMISANEQFDDSLSEPTEDFRDDFNPSYGDDDDGDAYVNNRIQTPIVEKEEIKPYSPVIPQQVIPEEPVAAVIATEPPAAPFQAAHNFEVDQQFNQQLHEHEDAIAHNIEDQKELTNSLRELFDKINSQGVDALAQQLTNDGNVEVAEKIESFVEAEADPNIDFQESLNIQDIQEVQSEVEELIQENPEFEAEEQPAEPGFSFEEPVAEEPAAFGEQPALGFEEPQSDSYDESNKAAFGEETNEGGYEAEPVNAYGEQPVNSYGEQPANELGNEFPEIGAEDDGDGGGGYDDGGGGESDAAEDDSDLSKNSERPIGESQDLQSQWAPPASSDGILSNNDAFIPQVSRELNDMTIDQTLSLATQVDPLHPVHDDIVNAASDSTDGRLDVHEDNEPYNDYGNYGNQYNRYNAYNNYNLRGNGFPMNNQMPRLGMNGHGQFGYRQQQQQPYQQQKKPTTNKDPDELVPVPKISLPALQTGQNAQDCNQLYNYGVSQNAVYVISPNGSSPLKARCEFTNSGGWTVIQYRHDGSQDFYQSYENYQRGFGDVKSEHWLGLDAIHQLTMDAAGNPKDTRVKVELIDAKNHKEYVEYDDFFIYGAETGFRANLGIKRHGDLEDAFSNIKGEKFTTYDRDQDTWKTGNCAESLHSAGWFSRCTYFNANGRYYSSGVDNEHKRDGIYWSKYPVDHRPADPSNPAKRLSAYNWSMKSTKISILVNPNQ